MLAGSLGPAPVRRVMMLCVGRAGVGQLAHTSHAVQLERCTLMRRLESVNAAPPLSPESLTG